MRKILSVIGTRPQLLKLDPTLADVIINSGQHYDNELWGQHLKEAKIKPKYNLGLDSDNVGLMIDKIRPILRTEEPDIVVVYGDTYSTVAGALAAAWEGIPVAHIEAGLRSGDMTMPEEINRVVADRLSSYKFCPTHTAIMNLRNEGLGDNTFHVGDPLLQNLKNFMPLKKRKDFGTYVLMSIHRQENLTKENLVEILEGVGAYGKPVLFPIHPHTRRLLKKYRIKVPKNIEVVKPLTRAKTLDRVFNSAFVITDSGGLQREAYWMLRHVYIIRTSTEWPEIIDRGWGTLLPANAKRIAEEIVAERRHLNAPELLAVNPHKEIRRVLKGWKNQRYFSGFSTKTVWGIIVWPNQPGW